MKKRIKDKSKDNMQLKIGFYILSLWLLFLLVFLLSVDIPICFDSNATFIGILPLIKRNWLAIISLVMMLLGAGIARKFKHAVDGVTNPPAKIISIQNENYEYLTFLTTYIIPLICINLEEMRYVIVLIILLIIIGSIFVKMDLYLGNPTLALLGYHLYRIKVEKIAESEDLLVISKDKLSLGSSIKWIKITEKVWVVKENKQQ